MGIFSGIGKFFKNIWSGIKRVFGEIMKPIGKLLNSKFGKILMLAVAVFTMGTALLAGVQGFMSSTGGFIAKFINGGKAFLNSLIGTKFDVAGSGPGPGAVAVPGADVMGPPVPTGGEAASIDKAVAATLEGADPTAIGGIVEQGGGKVGPMGSGSGGMPAEIMGPPAGAQPSPVGPPVPTGTAATAMNKAAEGGGKWLSQAMNAAKEFAMSDSGATVFGSMMQGYGRSQEIQAWLDEKARVGNMFANPNNPGMQRLAAHDWNIDASRGLANASNALAQRSSRSRYTPAIPFRRPAPAGG